MNPCPYCKGKSVELFKAKDYNRKVSENEFTYFKCLSCKLVFISKIPDDLGEYYTHEYYQIPSLSKLKKIARAERFKIEIVKRFVKSGTLLEIGAAFGVFAYQAKEAGFQTDAIEMDGNCCEYLRSTVGINVIESVEPHKTVGSMRRHNVVAMWHVLEHLPNPWESLETLAKNILPGGILVVATPNPEAFQFRLLGAHWPHVDAPRHLNIIPAKVLTEFLNMFGLEEVLLTTKDRGGKGWNRFGWQRYLMNLYPGKLAQRLLFLAGYFLSIPMSLWDEKDFNGCAYTAIFQKKVGL